ncbi:recombinase family protein [Turicibacter sp.]|uniref:recombinase family protein n=1 Tax=Turicibacter sp. TaxID=2049042 RepID=UPI001B5C2478|nr:recombinase family protein [Turicibacter sp.]MBP3903570.1 recombinase family protein [Turicibacter sp.]
MAKKKSLLPSNFENYNRIGYIRVSTQNQKINGNSLEDQRSQLKRAGCDLIVEEVHTAKDKSERPIFNELVQQSVEGQTIITTKIDRFSHSMIDGMKHMEFLLSKGVTVEILNFGKLDENFNSSNKLMFKIFTAFAEYEHDQIVERCQRGRDYKRANDPDYREGAKRKHSPDRINKVLDEIEKGMTYKDASFLYSISERTLYRRMRERRDNAYVVEQK